MSEIENLLKLLPNGLPNTTVNLGRQKNGQWWCEGNGPSPTPEEAVRKYVLGCGRNAVADKPWVKSVELARVTEWWWHVEFADGSGAVTQDLLRVCNERKPKPPTEKAMTDDAMFDLFEKIDRLVGDIERQEPPTWADLSNALFAPGGLIERHLPTRYLREQFIDTGWGTRCHLAIKRAMWRTGLVEGATPTGWKPKEET